MARIDDYRQAKRIASETLQEVPVGRLLERSGFEPGEDRSFRVAFLNRRYRVSFPDFEFSEPSETPKDIPLQEQVLILHYLIGADAGAPTGQWIPYREVPGASFYFSVFAKRAVDPLKKVFGARISGFQEAARGLGGRPVPNGDAAFEFLVFPKVPVRIILWKGDDEFPPEANILFDGTVSRMFSPEDVAWLASLLVYRLIALAPR